MTIRDKGSIASAPTEDEVIVNAEPVAYGYGSGANINVPFAHATPSAEIELQQSSSYASKPRASDAVPTAYSTGAPPQHPRSQPPPRVAVATGAPIIRASTQTPTATARAYNQNQNQGCCNGQTCCCITTIVLMVIFFCCILPFIIIFIGAFSALSAAMEDIDWDEEDPWNVTNWNVTNTTLKGYGFNESF